MENLELYDEIYQLVRYVGISNPKLSGGWVDADKVTKKILRLIHKYKCTENQSQKEE